jgi:hypothetical protein
VCKGKCLQKLKNQGEEGNKQLEQEIRGISEDELRAIIKDAGCDQKENIELIVVAVKLIPEILETIEYRFDKVDETHEEIKRLLLKLLQQKLPSIQFPLPPSLKVYNKNQIRL